MDTKKPDFLHLADLTVTELDTKQTEQSLTQFIKLKGFGGEVVVTAHGTPDAIPIIKKLTQEAVDVFIVRRGPSAAALGMALIKDAFKGRELPKVYADVARELIGGPILQKDTDAPKKRELDAFAESVELLFAGGGVPACGRFVYSLDGSLNSLEVIGATTVTVTAKNVKTLFDADMGYRIFEDTGVRRVFTVGVSPKGGRGSAFFDKNYFDPTRIRPATPEQIREYLILKYAHDNNL